MDGVVAAQTMGFGKVPGGVSEVRVETDDVEFAAALIDPVDRTAQGRRGDPASAMGRGCRRSRLVRCASTTQHPREETFP